MSTMNNVLFVYGTLAPGAENAHIMDGMAGEWRKASVRGIRTDKGWGMDKGYPGLIPDEEGDIVNGLIFTSDDLPANWSRLDLFEGAGYKRVSIRTTLEDGNTIKAQIYSTV